MSVSPSFIFIRFIKHQTLRACYLLTGGAGGGKRVGVGEAALNLLATVLGLVTVLGGDEVVGVVLVVLGLAVVGAGSPDCCQTGPECL